MRGPSIEDLNDLAYFAAVVRFGGFSAAARATGLEKTRLSRRIAELERRLGMQLLHRTTRRIALTEAGVQFHEHCSAVVDGAQSAYESVAKLRREPGGTLRMNCPQVLAKAYLAPILAEYLSRYPRVKIVLDTSYGASNLLEQKIDLAMRATAQMDYTMGLVSRELGRSRYVLVASPDYLRRHGTPEHPEDLGRFDTLVRLEDIKSDRARWALTAKDGREEAVTLSPRIEMDDIVLQMEAAKQHVGIALLPERTALSGIREGSLERVLPDWTGKPFFIYLLYPRARSMLPSLHSLIDLLFERLEPLFR